MAVFLVCAPTARAQAFDVPGVVIDVETRLGIDGVVLRVAGTDVSAATDARGAFVLRGLTAGSWVLRVSHVAYGAHDHEFTLDESFDARLEIRLAPQAIELEPVTVEALTQRDLFDRARGSSRNVVERDRIEAALGVSRHLGDLVRQTIPGIRVRQSNNLPGTDVCLEFRSAADISLLETRACNHPLVYLDGVPISNPSWAYGTIPLNSIQRMEVLPPGEAGARYGTGALYGVLLIETRDPRRFVGEPSYVPMSAPVTWDWSQEPSGHNGWRAAGGAFLGNAVGLTAGLAVASVCYEIDSRDQIVTDCSVAGNVGSAVAAFALPALGSALGARIGGRTAGSEGRFFPAMIGAGFSLLPGYVYSLSTVGRGSDTANAAGAALLLLGTPVATTIADRLFRKLR